MDSKNEEKPLPAVLFLVFNRPDHTRASFARLRQMRIGRLYVHCDGARDWKKGESRKVEQVREAVRSVDWPCEASYFFRETNVGLRQGLFEAISWFFQQEPEGIILEDDCVPDPSFFLFCAELLEKYRDDERIMHIAGSNLAEKVTASSPTHYVFSRFSLVWGWASWRRAWERMTLGFEGLDTFVQQGKIREMQLNRWSNVYMLDKFRAVRSGEIPSWAYAWFYSILANEGWCIIPRVNLVQNVGIGEEATNTTGRNSSARLRAGRMTFPLVHPEAVEAVPKFEQAFFYHTQKKQIRLWLWMILKGLGLR